MFALAFRPVTIVVVHLLMLVLAVLMLPMWLRCAFGDSERALAFVREFRGWSHDVIAKVAVRR